EVWRDVAGVGQEREVYVGEQREARLRLQREQVVVVKLKGVVGPQYSVAADRRQQVERDLMLWTRVALDGPGVKREDHARTGQRHVLQPLGFPRVEREGAVGAIPVIGQRSAIQEPACRVASMIACVGGNRGLGMKERRLLAQAHRGVVRE